jgi:transcriptional regulator of arginine metabolism
MVSAEASANLVVLRTPPGAAQYFAGAVDRVGWESILGTIAGDDTILLITRSPSGGSAIAQQFLIMSRTGKPGYDSGALQSIHSEKDEVK